MQMLKRILYIQLKILAILTRMEQHPFHYTRVQGLAEDDPTRISKLHFEAFW